LALFDADWLGWGDYPPPANKRPSEIPGEKWTSMGPRDGQLVTLTGPRVVVLTREANWAISAARRTTDGRLHIEVGYTSDESAGAVVAKLTGVATTWNPAALVVSRGAAAEVLPSLEAAGFEAKVPTLAEEAQACGGFLSDALAGVLSHSGQPGLSTAVSTAFKRELPSGSFVWQVFDPASHAQLMGATLARWALLKYGAAPKRKTVPARTAAASARTRTDHTDAMEMAF
jgi:hypothetical protein